MKQNFFKLVEMLKESGCKASLSFGEWQFRVLEDGNYELFYGDEFMLYIQNGEIFHDVLGFGICGDGNSSEGEMLSGIEIVRALLGIPGLALNIQKNDVEKELSMLQYEAMVYLPREQEDESMKRSWYMSKPGEEEGRRDYLFFDEDEEGFCTVVAQFENLTEPEFTKALKGFLIKYKYTIEIPRKCPMCGKSNTMCISMHEYFVLEFHGNKSIKELFPHMTTFEREFLMTGYCPECQKLLFNNNSFSRENRTWILAGDTSGNVVERGDES